MEELEEILVFQTNDLLEGFLSSFLNASTEAKFKSLQILALMLKMELKGLLGPGWMQKHSHDMSGRNQSKIQRGTCASPFRFRRYPINYLMLGGGWVQTYFLIYWLLLVIARASQLSRNLSFLY